MDDASGNQICAQCKTRLARIARLESALIETDSLLEKIREYQGRARGPTYAQKRIRAALKGKP